MDKPTRCWGRLPWDNVPQRQPRDKPSHHVCQVDHGLGEVAGENHRLAELQELGGHQGPGWARGATLTPHPTSPRTPRAYQLMVIHHRQLDVLGLTVNRVLGSAYLPAGAHS